MSYISIQPKDFFNIKLWTGNGSTNAQTGLGFQPDWVWIKQRGGTTDHHSYDSVRGVTKALATNDAGAETTKSTGLTAFGTDGFTLGADGGVNGNSNTYVGWSWKMGTTSGLSGGTITPSAYSINTNTKVGLYRYTGNGSSSQTIAHGLGKKPRLVMWKGQDNAEQWRLHFIGEGMSPYSHMLKLNSSDGEKSQNNALSAVSDTLVTFGNDGCCNLNGQTYVMWVFADANGYSKIGTYKGNSNNSGVFVHTGMRPSWVMIKRADSDGEYWNMADNQRQDDDNPADRFLYADRTDAEGTKTTGIDFYSNGFKIRGTDGAMNNSSGRYAYMAFAADPQVASTGDPGNAG